MARNIDPTSVNLPGSIPAQHNNMAAGGGVLEGTSLVPGLTWLLEFLGVLPFVGTDKSRGFIALRSEVTTSRTDRGIHAAHAQSARLLLFSHP